MEGLGVSLELGFRRIWGFAGFWVGRGFGVLTYIGVFGCFIGFVVSGCFGVLSFMGGFGGFVGFGVFIRMRAWWGGGEMGFLSACWGVLGCSSGQRLGEDLGVFCQGLVVWDLGFSSGQGLWDSPLHGVNSGVFIKVGIWGWIWDFHWDGHLGDDFGFPSRKGLLGEFSSR